MRTSNPVFNSGTYQNAPALNHIPLVELEDRAKPNTMSMGGTTIKTGILLGITIAVAAMTWSYYVGNSGAIFPTMIVSLVLGLASCFVMLKKPALAPVLAPVFAVGEGGFVSAISVSVIMYSPLATYVGGEADGLALVGQAAGLTFAIAIAMLSAYAAGLIRLRGVVGKVVIVMTAGVMVYYLGAWVFNMIFGPVIPRLGWDAGPIGIGFSAFVVVLASLNLVLDFQFIEDGVEKGLPKHFEWVGAFALLTTLVWLYIEVLRLIVKLRSVSD
ncbi:MAG: Bax inhibitor-1/YccA family protein [Planctomycetota bacterium]